MELPAWLQRSWPALLILSVTAALFQLHGLFGFLTVESFAGRDLAANYAFAWLMQQQLLDGTLFTWTNQFLLGTPAFGYYPPLFFLTTAVVSLLPPIDLATGYTGIVFASVFLLPILTYYLLRNVSGNREAFFIGIYILYFLFVYPPISQTYLVLNTGLVAQGFSFLLLLPGIALLLGNPSPRRRIGAGILLGLTILAHPFVGVVGVIAAAVHAGFARTRQSLVPLLLAGMIALPWFLAAATYLPFTGTYTMAPAIPGTFLLLLLPLIILGGVQQRYHELFAVFLLTTIIALVEVPVIAQQVRFFTYAIAFGSLLAGAGAFWVYQYSLQHFDCHCIGVLLLLPVIALPLHTQLTPAWEFTGDADPLIAELQSKDPGRVLVETRADSIHDAFVLQSVLPRQTQHWAVNDVHLDASPSANYILTLEHWISEEAIPNPLCRTCNTTASTDIVRQRLDDLGIRYVVTRTDTGAATASQTLRRIGAYAEYRLFENTADFRLVEPLQWKPVALVGAYTDWQQVNDHLFASNVTVPVVWLQEQPQNTSRFSAVLPLEKPEGTVAQLSAIELTPIPTSNISTTVLDRAVNIATDEQIPVRVKTSYFPSHRSNRPLYAANFNTMVVYAADETSIRMR